VKHKKMALQKFDSTLKSALENLEVPYDPSTWAALESRLDSLPAPDAVDKAVRPALEQIEPAYDPSAWTALSSKMDSIARVRRLRMTKLAEAAIFLLLLLNLNGFFGVVESVTNPKPAPKTLQGPIAGSGKARLKKSQASESYKPVDTAPLASLSLAEKVASYVQSITNSLTQKAENQYVGMVILRPQSMDSKASSLLDPNLFYSQTGILRFIDATSLPHEDTKSVLFAHSEILLPNLVQQPSITSKKGLYAVSYVSFDQNRISEADHSDRSSNYGGGLAVGRRKGKWGIEGGLAYSVKSYEPKRKNVEYQNDPFNGIYLFYVNQVDAQIVSVPVKATRQIAKFGKSSAHAVAGITTHLAASKNYAYKTVHYPPPSPSPNPNPTTNPATPFPDGKGLLEQGGVTQNVYASADIGLRLEHSIGKRYVAFVEPAYRQSIAGGLGPQTSRINTFSLQAGVMASL
jgi:hypothetical protein